MSNVVPLFGKNIKEPVVTTTKQEAISTVIDWAEGLGIDVHNDVEFKYGLTYFLGQLEYIAAKRMTA